jgi:hypothetical protein
MFRRFALSETEIVIDQVPAHHRVEGVLGNIVLVAALLALLFILVRCGGQAQPERHVDLVVLVPGLSTTVTVVKATPGNLDGMSCQNSNTAAADVQVFDASAASQVTLGTTKPKGFLTIPATSEKELPSTPKGIYLAKGLALAATTGIENSMALDSGVDCTVAIR